MDESYLSYYDGSFNSWPSQAENELGPNNETEPESCAYSDPFGLLDTSTDRVNVYQSGSCSSNDLGGQLTRTTSDADGRPVHTRHDRGEYPSSTAFNCPAPVNETNRDTDMLYWTPVAYTSVQYSSDLLAPRPSPSNTQAGAVVNYSAVPRTFSAYPSSLQASQQRSPSAVVQTEQQDQARQTADYDDDERVTSIGSVLSNGRFGCSDKKCSGQSFGRLPELRRHYTTHHAADKPNFWCHDQTCPRSVSGGDEPFHRKDKLVAHVNSMHS